MSHRGGHGCTEGLGDDTRQKVSKAKRESSWARGLTLGSLWVFGAHRPVCTTEAGKRLARGPTFTPTDPGLLGVQMSDALIYPPLRLEQAFPVSTVWVMGKRK